VLLEAGGGDECEGQVAILFEVVVVLSTMFVSHMSRRSDNAVPSSASLSSYSRFRFFFFFLTSSALWNDVSKTRIQSQSGVATYDL